MDDVEQYYFAYGANLDVAEMQRRCPTSTFIGTAVLPQYRFIIFSHGVASVSQDPSRSVYGIVWSVTPQDINALDKFEGVAQGRYARSSVEVQLQDGTTTQALIYLGADATFGTPRDGYLENIVQNAQQHGFPAEYIEELESWLRM